MKYEFIYENKENHTIKEMCRILKVSKSGYYKYLAKRGVNKQAEYKKLAELMIELEKNNNWELGAEGLRQGLAKQGIRAGLSKVHRIKRMFGIYPKSLKRRKHNRRKYKDNILSENVLNRQFAVDDINKVWVTDIKYIPTDEGWDYLCVVMDLGSRRIVGIAEHERMTVGLTMEAMERAINCRRPNAGLICHSDYAEENTMPKNCWIS